MSLNSQQSGANSTGVEKETFLWTNPPVIRRELGDHSRVLAPMSWESCTVVFTTHFQKKKTKNERTIKNRFMTVLLWSMNKEANHYSENLDELPAVLQTYVKTETKINKIPRHFTVH